MSSSTRVEPLPSSSSWLTRSSAFKRFSNTAFVLTADDDGRVGRSELYAGILMVHLNLAKYAGAAACYPPSRTKVNELFDAVDDDNSGYIDEEEFKQIVVICCVGVTSRIVVYYTILIFMVPYITAALLSFFWSIDNFLGLQMGNFQMPAFFQWMENFLSGVEMMEKAVGLVRRLTLHCLDLRYIGITNRLLSGIVHCSHTFLLRIH